MVVFSLRSFSLEFGFPAGTYTIYRVDQIKGSTDASNARSQDETVELFLFELDGELYAVSVHDVDQVMKIPPVTSVPGAPSSILGIFHHRGKVVVTIDLLKRMGVPRTSSFVPLYMFISEKEKNSFAVVVDRVFSVIKVLRSELTPLTSVFASKIDARFVEGMILWKEPSRSRRSPENFMIQPKGEGVESAPEERPARPVLWLNVNALLAQEDILDVAKGQGDSASQT